MKKKKSVASSLLFIKEKNTKAFPYSHEIEEERATTAAEKEKTKPKFFNKTLAQTKKLKKKLPLSLAFSFSPVLSLSLALSISLSLSPVPSLSPSLALSLSRSLTPTNNQLKKIARDKKRKREKRFTLHPCLAPLVGAPGGPLSFWTPPPPRDATSSPTMLFCGSTIPSITPYSIASLGCM